MNKASFRTRFAAIALALADPERLVRTYDPVDRPERERYLALAGTEVINGQKTTMLELKPKNAKLAAQIKSIVLWLDEERWVPVQMKHNEVSGDYQTLKLTNIKINGGISNSVHSTSDSTLSHCRQHTRN